MTNEEEMMFRLRDREVVRPSKASESHCTEGQMNRFDDAVVGASEAIHSSLVGSGDAFSDDELVAIIHWLRWRVTDGWQEPSTPYDIAVRQLALAVLDLVKGVP